MHVAFHAQMVDRMDQGLIPAQVVPNTYDALWQLVSKALYRTHVEGKLKVLSCPATIRQALELLQSRLDAGVAGPLCI